MNFEGECERVEYGGFWREERGGGNVVVNINLKNKGPISK